MIIIVAIILGTSKPPKTLSSAENIKGLSKSRLGRAMVLIITCPTYFSDIAPSKAVVDQ